jgi:hypothetical protein
MFNWFRGSRYREEVLDTVAVLLTDTSSALRRSLHRQYPGIEKAIKTGEEESQNKHELAITITQVVLAATIEQMPDDARKRSIVNGLATWIDSGGVERFQHDVSNGRCNDIDGFELRLRAAVSSIWEMQGDGRVENDSCARFLREILGALEGLDAEEREKRRYLHVLESVKETLKIGADDDSDLMPIDYARAQAGEFSGVEYEIRIISTPSGLAMQREDTGSTIVERRTITQDLLKQVPREAEKLIFVNLNARSGEIYSCVIAEPEHDVFGNQRAAWWSLAKTIVRVTEAKANGVRMTEMAHAHASAVARAVWDSAIEQTPIENMRDQLMQMRHIHFQVINQGMQSAENEAQRLGREIGLAMVMAVQSEDEKLERFAFNSLKKFIWMPGEEPQEFWHHESS